MSEQKAWLEWREKRFAKFMDDLEHDIRAVMEDSGAAKGVYEELEKVWVKHYKKGIEEAI